MNEIDLDLEKKANKIKRKLDFICGITPETQEKVVDVISWNLKMMERDSVKKELLFHPKRGEIWLVDFGYNVGGEIDKERPCVVVSYNEYNNKSKLATVVPITRSRFSHKTQFRITEDCIEEVYNSIEGTVKTEQITTKSQTRFKAKIGELNAKGKEKLSIALINHLLLNEYVSDDIKEKLNEEPDYMNQEEFLNSINNDEEKTEE